MRFSAASALGAAVIAIVALALRRDRAAAAQIAACRWASHHLPASLAPASCLSSAMEGEIDVAPTIVVVGAGLAGQSAALAAAEACPRCAVVLLEKEPRVGGNSAKASSGINAVTPEHGDSPQRYRDDTLRSGGGLSSPPLVDALVGDSAAGLEALQAAGMDLSGTVQLGGHTARRTHFPPHGPVGWTIISALKKRLDAALNVRVVTGARATGLVVREGRVEGVRCLVGRAEDGSAEEREFPGAAVVLATGGFGANRALLRRHAPAAADLPTTNGHFARGEGLELAAAAGAALIQLDRVQVHPTGLLDPADPGADTKVRRRRRGQPRFFFFFFFSASSAPSPLCLRVHVHHQTACADPGAREAARRGRAAAGRRRPPLRRRAGHPRRAGGHHDGAAPAKGVHRAGAGLRRAVRPRNPVLRGQEAAGAGAQLRRRGRGHGRAAGGAGGGAAGLQRGGRGGAGRVWQDRVPCFGGPRGR